VESRPAPAEPAVLVAVSGKDEIARVPTTTAQTRATYDRISRYYELLEGFWERPARQAGLDALRPVAGERLLEVGCGPGYALVEIARAAGPHGRVVGVDLAEGMCHVARGRVARQGLTARAGVVQADASRLPLASSCFDGAFLSFVLELFDTPRIPLVLAQCRRVLRPGGRLVAVSLSKEGPESSVRRLYEQGHARFPRLLDCRPIYAARALAEAGLTVSSARRLSLWGLPVEVVQARA
jgi:ubiquinone/menaquinone biosynthesis C-methylase UbiE